MKLNCCSNKCLNYYHISIKQCNQMSRLSVIFCLMFSAQSGAEIEFSTSCAATLTILFYTSFTSKQLHWAPPSSLVLVHLPATSVQCVQTTKLWRFGPHSHCVLTVFLTPTLHESNQHLWGMEGLERPTPSY